MPFAAAAGKGGSRFLAHTDHSHPRVVGTPTCGWTQWCGQSCRRSPSGRASTCRWHLGPAFRADCTAMSSRSFVISGFARCVVAVSCVSQAFRETAEYVTSCLCSSRERPAGTSPNRSRRCSHAPRFRPSGDDSAALSAVQLAVLLRGRPRLAALTATAGSDSASDGGSASDFSDGSSRQLISISISVSSPSTSISSSHRTRSATTTEIESPPEPSSTSDPRARACPSAMSRSDTSFRESSDFRLISNLGTTTPDLGEVCTHRICHGTGGRSEPRRN